jgi:predicted acylesterase/phospholipase RssA
MTAVAAAAAANVANDSSAADGAIADAKTREVRLGLVMYGGVSLAVYINGVAHELFRAVRGRGVYRLIKRLTRSDISVDVLSGTSAGGINGIFLAYALCNQVEFGACAALWRKHGDIDRLLRPTDAPPEEYTSLLNSEGFYQPKLVEAFASMADNKSSQYPGPEDNTPVAELDLMVTGTDFNGRVYDTVDDRGNIVQVKDHRTLFWLKHRDGRKQPFSPVDARDDAPADVGDKLETHQALAKLARITSCFPAAFAPVVVTADGAGADARLRLWGALGTAKDRVFLDGGVLDNKPFTSTLDAIYHRTAARPVSRHLLFVEPDPEQFDADAAPVVPSLIRAALDSLTKLPGYESIADDLSSLTAHNDQVVRLAQIARITEGLPPISAHAKPVVDEVHRRARLSGLSDGVLAELFQTRPGASPREGAARASLVGLRGWFQQTYLEPTGAGETLLDTFDVDLRLRRLFTVTYACEAALLEKPALLRTLNNQVQVLEMIRGAMQAAVARVARKATDEEAGDRPVDPAKIWDQVGAAVSRVLAVPAPADYRRADPHTTLLEDDARKALKKVLDDAVRADGPPTRAPDFLKQADAFADTLLGAAGGEIARSDAGFGARDQVLFPLEMVSGIHERDVIHTVRVSPIDAQDGLSKKALKQKVTGANLGHFAAFFKRSWRSNDILWGRLDGACELVDTLLDAERLNDLRRSGGWNAPAEAELADYLPQLSAEKRRAFAAALGGMSDDASTIAALPAIKELLIEAAQGEILVEGLPQVIEDAAEEQMLWNEYNRRTVEGPGGAKTKFVPGAEVLDPAVIAQASAEIAKGAMAALVNEKPATTLVARFRDKYDVGSETLDDIPRVVLLDVLARALLVVRNSLLQAAGQKADRLTGSLLYKAFLDWPLETLATLAGGLRRSPSGRRGVILGTLLYVALSAIVVFKTRLDFGALGSWGPALFIGLPALLLAASSFLISVRSDDSIAATLGRLLWALVRLGCAVAAVGILAALWRTPAVDLCKRALAAAGVDRESCAAPLPLLTKLGRVLVTAAVFLTPLARIGIWFKRKVAWS